MSIGFDKGWIIDRLLERVWSNPDTRKWFSFTKTSQESGTSLCTENYVYGEHRYSDSLQFFLDELPDDSLTEIFCMFFSYVKDCTSVQDFISIVEEKGLLSVSPTQIHRDAYRVSWNSYVVKIDKKVYVARDAFGASKRLANFTDVSNIPEVLEWSGLSASPTRKSTKTVMGRLNISTVNTKKVLERMTSGDS